jgi:hypothetical protein
MAFLDKAKKAVGKAAEVGGDVAAKSKRQAQRGKLEIEAKRLSGKIDEEKNQIGQLLYPLLQSGQLTVDVPEVGDRMRAIAQIESEVAEKRAEIEALLHADAKEEAVAAD